MAITDNKITTGEVNSNHVKNAPNVLTGTAQTNKNYFDKLPELIVSKHNNLIDDIGTDKQDTLVSGTNIKTVNSTSLLGSGDVAVQETLVSGTNIKTVNSTSLLGSGDIAVQPTLVSGTNIKTVNSTSLLGSGNVAVQETLVSGTNIKTINNNSILGSGNMSVGDDKATGNARIFYGTCSTAAETQAKTVTCSSYDALTAGDIIVVKFTYANLHATPTLNVNSKGAKSIKQIKNGYIQNLGKVGSVQGTCEFIYDGTRWVLQGADDDTIYLGYVTTSITVGDTSADINSGYDVCSYSAFMDNHDVILDFNHGTNTWSISSAVSSTIYIIAVVTG